MIEKREAPILELLTVRDYLRWATSRFNAAELYFGHGTDNAWDEAVQLVMHSLHLPWDSSPDLLNARLTLEERRILVDVIERRVTDRIPSAYITGQAWFGGMAFNVDDRVLVPRSPLAETIAQEFQPWLEQYPQRILDLCTGSGCIGLACAATFIDAEITLSDISSDALIVANSNIQKHHMGDQVTAIESDLFSNLEGRIFDLIVSNPPYVNIEDLSAMPQEYQAEPEIALGSGNDGLDFTRQLLREARAHLSDHGLLVVEVGNSWPALEAAYPLLPFTWLEFESGGHGIFVLSAEQLDQYSELLT
jgi:ribosomal protein L3 glutamine methyltransferase